jgi:hypothetical protein
VAAARAGRGSAASRDGTHQSGAPLQRNRDQGIGAMRAAAADVRRQHDHLGSMDDFGLMMGYPEEWGGLEGVPLLSACTFELVAMRVVQRLVWRMLPLAEWSI